MNFYTQQHKHYCGIDLHAKAMYVCILAGRLRSLTPSPSSGAQAGRTLSAPSQYQ